MKKVLVILTSVVIVLGLIVTNGIAAINPAHTNNSIHEKTMESESNLDLTLFTDSGPGQRLKNHIISSFYDDFIRWRPVVICPEIRSLTSFNVLDTIALNVFDDTMLTGLIKSVDTNVLGTEIISGIIIDSFFGTFVIAVTGPTFLITIRSPETNQLFTTLSNENSHFLVELDLSTIHKLPSAPPLIPPSPLETDGSPDPYMSYPDDYGFYSNDDDVVDIDVMIVYTRAAENWASGHGGIDNVIATAIEKGRITLENSQTLVNLNLVHAAQVDYDEGTSGVSTHLARLKGVNDGYMDDVHVWRDTYGADLVQLFTGTVGYYAGAAYLLQDKNGRSEYGFSVSRVDYASTYTSIHEFAHNIGCHHHKQQNVSPGPTYWGDTWPENTWSAGWRWAGPGTSRYCTVMTYESGQYFPDGITHVRVPYFSNPDLSYLGSLTGHPEDGDNARTIREMRHVIAGYRERSSMNYPPYESHSPVPRDDAVDVTMPVAILSWYGGDPNAGDFVNYTIYFGTEPDPPVWGTIGPYKGFQRGPLTVNLGVTLVPKETYFWKVSAEDNHGLLTSGPMWCFTAGSVLWNMTEVVSSESTAASEYPSLAVDTFGTVHVVWSETHGPVSNILYKSRSVDGRWSAIERINSESTMTSRSPSLAVDVWGTVHVAWEDNTDYGGSGTDFDILYKFKPVGGTWSMTEVVSTESTSHGFSPSLFVDDRGRIHIAWSDQTNYSGSGSDRDIFYKSKHRSCRSWPTITEVVSTESTEGSLSPSLGVDGNGTVHVAWQDSTNYGGVGFYSDIFYKSKPADGSWSMTEVISEDTPRGWRYGSSLAVDTFGTVHVAWSDLTAYGGSGNDYDIFYKSKSIGCSWTITEVVSTESTGHSMSPSLGVDAWGTVHVAWQDSTNYGGCDWDIDVFYKCKPFGGIWTTTQVVSTESTSSSWSPSLFVDFLGTVHVSWQDQTEYEGCGSDWDIFYKYRGPPVLPSVETDSFDVGFMSARLYGALRDDGGQSCQIRFRYRVSSPLSTTSDMMRWSYSSFWNGSYTTGQSFYAVVVDLNPGTTYEFQAGARNVAGETWSDSVEFTTLSENQPPFVPAYPFPANGSVDVDIFSVLMWTGGDPDPGDSVTYDVYFGSSNPPEKQVSNQSALIYDPCFLNYGTTYYWRIAAWDNHGASTNGSLWMFTVMPFMGSWSPVEIVSNESTGISWSPSLFVDSWGTVHVAWEDMTNYSGSGSDRDIFYKSKPVDGNWTITEVVSTESTDASEYPSLFVDLLGTVHVAWSDLTKYGGSGTDRNIFYKSNPAGGSWGMTEVISTESMNYSCSPSLFVDIYGTVHITWWALILHQGGGFDLDIYYKSKPVDGNWTEVEMVSTESIGYIGASSLFVDTYGTVHVAWEGGIHYSSWDIFYKSKPIDGSWPTVTEVVSTESTGHSYRPSLFVDLLGMVHIVWEDSMNYSGSGPDFDIYYKSKPVGSNWPMFTELVSTESTSDSWSASLFVDSWGTVHVAWEDMTNFNVSSWWDWDIFYKSKPVNGNWTDVEVVSTESTSNSMSPSLAVDLFGNVHVAWRDLTAYGGSGTDWDIFYKFKANLPS